MVLVTYCQLKKLGRINQCQVTDHNYPLTSCCCSQRIEFVEYPFPLRDKDLDIMSDGNCCFARWKRKEKKWRHSFYPDNVFNHMFYSCAVAVQEGSQVHNVAPYCCVNYYFSTNITTVNSDMPNDYPLIHVGNNLSCQGAQLCVLRRYTMKNQKRHCSFESVAWSSFSQATAQSQ